MACLTNCSVCETGLVDSHLCNECSQEIADRAKQGLPYDENAVREKVQAARRVKAIREMEEHCKIVSDSMNRDNWRKYRDKMESLQEIINEALTEAEQWKGLPGFDAIIEILEKGK